MSETFYRVHGADEEFSADSAWSSDSGIPRTAADRVLCLSCDGEGRGPDDYDLDENGEITEIPCPDCGGEGSVPADYGYSCCASAEDLIAYFGGPQAVIASLPVIIFEGHRTGTCPDGEPLAVPSRVIRTLRWDEFIKEHGA